MVEFIGIGESPADTVTEIARILHQTQSTKISRSLRALYLAAIAGAVSIDQILLAGGYGDYRFRSVTAATNFLWSLSKNRGMLERKTDGRVHDVGLFALTSSGYDTIMKQTQTLIDSGVITGIGDNAMEALNDFCSFAAKRKWKRPKNINHSNGINDLLASLLSSCTVPVKFLRELNVYSAGEPAKCESYISHLGSSFRMDAFALIKGLPAAVGEPRDIAVFYEQDTGTQSGMVISQKLSNYTQFVSEYYSQFAQSENSPSFLPCLLFGLQCSYDTTKRNEDTPISDGKDTREENARNNFISHFQFWADMSGSDSLRELKGLLLNAYNNTNTAFYKKALEFLNICAENPDISGISDIRAFYGSIGESSRTAVSIRDTIADMDVFIRRRDIFTERIRAINADYLFKMGLRACVLPNSAMDYYIRFLYPCRTSLYNSLPVILSQCGIPSPYISECGSSADMFGIHTWDYIRITTAGGKERLVIFENFSHDLTARTRIETVMRYSGNMLYSGIPVTLLVFFADIDLCRVRSFATGDIAVSQCPQSANEAFMPDSFLGSPKGEILYVNMDEVAAVEKTGSSAGDSATTLGLTFTPDGSGYYRQILDTAKFIPIRDMIPCNADSCTERTRYDPAL